MEFYKNSALINFIIWGNILVVLILGICSIAFKDMLFLWIALAHLGIYIIVALIISNWLFAKVIILNDDIKITFMKKVYKTLSWKKIVKVERTLDNISQNLSLYNNDGDVITFNISKKKAHKIAEICPNENIKKQIENIKFPFDFSKRKN